MSDLLAWIGAYCSGIFTEGYTGILSLSQYSFLFILSVNPALFQFFEKKHFVLFGIGALLSVVNHRAILPFMLLIILDLDYSMMGKREKLAILAFFMLQVLILLSFGGWE